MTTLATLLQAVAQTAQQPGPPAGPAGPGGPGGPPPGFSYLDALTELVRFVGFFLAVGAVGFRFGIVRRVRGMTHEARTILRADNAALLGIIGVFADRAIDTWWALHSVGSGTQDLRRIAAEESQSV